MSTIVENVNTVDVEIEQKYSVTTTTGSDVEIVEPDYIVHAQRKEYKVVSDNIYIPKFYDDAPQWMKDIIGTVVNVKTAVAIGNLNDALEALRTLATELEVAKNTYTMSIISSNDIDQRINTKIETLNSSLMEADATILNIAQTAVTPEEASAIAINTLSASLSASGEIGSFIANMNAAFATLDSATTESIEYMESSIDAEFSANAQVVQTVRTYVGIDEAGASTGTGLSAYLEGSDGTIGSADSDVANNIYVDSQGNIKSKFEYNSSLNINGVTYNSGFGLATSLTPNSGLATGQSEFWIKADKFKIMSADGGTKSSYSPFSIDTNTGNILFNGVVTFGRNPNIAQKSDLNIRPNLVRNGSLENGFDWISNNPNWVKENGSWGSVALNSTYSSGAYSVKSLDIKVSGDTNYVLTGDSLLIASDGYCYFDVIYFDSKGNNIGESEQSIVYGTHDFSDSIERRDSHVIQITTPSNVDYCSVRFVFSISNPTLVGFRRVKLEKGNLPWTQYSSDATISYSWQDEVQNVLNNKTTVVNGSTITTGTINGDRFNANSIDASKIVVGTITADRIKSGEFSISNQADIFGYITSIVTGTPELTIDNTNIIGSFSIDNNFNREIVVALFGSGRSGGIDVIFSNAEQINFGIFDNYGNKIFDYGYSPMYQDSKSIGFRYIIPANTTITFTVRGLKNAEHVSSLSLHPVWIGVPS